MKDNQGIKVKVLTFLLIFTIIAIIVMGYFIHTFYNEKANENNKVNSLNEEISELKSKYSVKEDEDRDELNEETSNNYSYSDIQGFYKGIAKDKDNEGMNRNYELYLSENGTYIYQSFVDNQVGTIGNYTISGDKIILNYLFNTGNDISLTATEGKKTLNIGKNNMITDSEPERTKATSIELKKENEPDDPYYSTNGVNYLINNYSIINKHNSENE